MEKVKALFKSRRFWTAVGGVVVVVAQANDLVFTAVTIGVQERAGTSRAADRIEIHNKVDSST